ncbi:hypothetical protein KUG47_07720 [Falsochrobactrum sp. TDYN1]|uniref:Uncharacterized protein n=1 Tax=Falsochrobactrum tianjinense TaxID=2706015 RepID=A0A949USZ0_9HYPH|nr:hypothetical protein [Falsochrobactrum sp. TDYN1]MBV2143384.1 hypothetical protein [Falsochrobactrum sp. TDYN1]
MKAIFQYLANYHTKAPIESIEVVHILEIGVSCGDGSTLNAASKTGSSSSIAGNAGLVWTHGQTHTIRQNGGVVRHPDNKMPDEEYRPDGIEWRMIMPNPMHGTAPVRQVS